jgi:hypothetical protein
VGKRIAITADGAGPVGAGATWGAGAACAALIGLMAIVVVFEDSDSGRVMRTVATRATAGLRTAGLWSAATPEEPAPGERAALV